MCSGITEWLLCLAMQLLICFQPGMVFTAHMTCNDSISVHLKKGLFFPPKVPENVLPSIHVKLSKMKQIAPSALCRLIFFNSGSKTWRADFKPEMVCCLKQV